MAVISTIQFKRGRAEALAKWTRIPLAGEPIFDIDNSILKIGDGVHLYKDLPALGGGGSGGMQQIVFDTYFNFPSTGKANMLYIARDKQMAYIWDDSDASNTRYVELGLSGEIIDGGEPNTIY